MLIYNILRKLPAPFQGLAERFDDSPIESPETLSHFIRTRASYIAQTSLFGYLKTRMGTKYRVLFEDDVFSKAIRHAAARVFASCLSDLTIYCVARVVVDGGLSDEKARTLAERIYTVGLNEGLADIDEEHRSADARPRFQMRVADIKWENVGRDLDAFEQSGNDLIRHAPVTDEFKELDEEIVKNSIHLRWNNVRDQWEKRMRPSAITETWRSSRKL